MDLSQLTPRHPYLLRAFYEWLLDNQLTPHLVVDVTLPGVQVPMNMRVTGKSYSTLRRVLSAIWNWRMMRCALTRALVAFRVRFLCRWLPCWLSTPVKMAQARCLNLKLPTMKMPAS